MLVPCQASAHFTRLFHLGWGQCGHGLSSRTRESCDTHVIHSLLFFFDTLKRDATELFNGTLKLRCSSTPFSNRFPTWSVTHHLSSSPVVGHGPGFRTRFPDQDPVDQRPAKHFRITGKSSAHKCSLEVLGELPTPKRWKRLIPPGAGQPRDEVGCAAQPFFAQGVGRLRVDLSLQD